MLSFRLLILIVLASLAVATPNARACVCVEQGDVKDQYQAAKAVFVGRVIALQIEPVKFDGGESENTVATFKIVRRWKGPTKSTIRVLTCGTQHGWCSCGVDFRLGASYLVVATGGRLATGSCDLTTDADSAVELEKQFDDLKTRFGN